MGNNISTEAPRRAPQKLSKSRTGSNLAAAASATPDEPTPGSIPATVDDQFSNPGFASPAHLFPSPSAAASPSIAGGPFDSHDSSVPPEPAASTGPSSPFLSAETLFRKRSSMISISQRPERNRRSIFRSKSSAQQSQSHAQERPVRSNTISAGAAPDYQPIPPLPPLEGQGQPDSNPFVSEENGESSQQGRLTVDSWQGAAGSRVSWNYDLTSYEAKRLLSLREEPVLYEEGSVLSDRLKSSVVSEVTWKSSHPTTLPAQPESTPMSRANSDLSMYTPVRRRSIIQTPGVATRQNSVRGTRSNYRHSHPPTPNLSRQPSRESMANRVQSMPPDVLADDPPPPLPLGLVTPSEGDYQTFGAFKLGTLRIMNASPVPASPELDGKHMISPAGSDYFSAEPSPVLGAATKNDGSPPTGALTTLPNAQLSQSKETKDAASSNYLADIQFTPFTLDANKPASPELLTTSKHTALEDQLFEDDCQPEYSAVEVLDLRLDPSAKSNGSAASSQLTSGLSTRSSKSMARSDSGIVASPTSDTSHKPLSKTDSGYSSNVSLRSLRTGAKPPVPEKDISWVIATTELHLSPSGPRKEASLPGLVIPSPIVLTIEEDAPVPAPPSREAPPPPPPPKDLKASTRTSLPPATQAAPKNTRSADRLYAGYMAATSGVAKRRSSALAPVTSFRTRDLAPGSPESIPTSPMSATSDTSISALSIGSGSQKPGRLSRFLSLRANRPRGPPTVHTTHVDDLADIPSIPDVAQEHLNARTGQFPTTAKRLAVRPTVSKETLNTILSVGSLEIHGADAEGSHRRPESPMGLNRRHTYSPGPSSLSIETTATAAVPLRNPIPRKPVPVRYDAKQEFSEHLESKTTETKAQPVVRGESVIVVPESEVGLAITTAGTLDESQGLFCSPTGKPMSMAANLERSVTSRNVVPVASSQGSPITPALPSPLIPEVKSRHNFNTPPPVSLRTRKQGPLRVPAPLRPRSTPPRSQIMSSVSRPQLSQEELQRYYALHNQQNSANSVQPTSVPGPPVPVLHQRRSMNFERNHMVANSSPKQQQHPQLPRRPDWQVKTDHDSTRRVSSLMPQHPGYTHDGRHESMGGSSQASVGGSIRRPLSAQQFPNNQQYQPRQEGQRLRHRASYDGYSQLQQQQHNGGGPPIKVSPSPDTWRRRQTSFNPQTWSSALNQWDKWDPQLGNYQPPYVPRGARNHSRARSMSMGGGLHTERQAPYRILHSYNSPAYRNAPIWG